MTDKNPITPPPKLVREWAQVNGEKDLERFWLRLATQAARYGADQELEACVEWMKIHLHSGSNLSKQLRAARRPNPPSLKEQALTQLDSLHADLKVHGLGTNTDTIRRALEQLND